MKKNRILWIAPYPYEIAKNDKNATPKHFAPWITSLAKGIKDDVDLTIISFSRVIESNQTFSGNGINFHFVKLPHPLIEFPLLFKGNLVCLKRYVKNFDFEKFDMVHIHGTEHQYASALLGKNIPKIISIQGLLHKTYKYNNSFNFNWFNWRFLKGYEVKEIKQHKNFICRTHWDQSSIKAINDKASFYHNWEIIRNEFFVDAHNKDSYNLVFLGGLISIKGINEVLLALKKCIDRNNKYSLTICGDGKKDQLYRILKKHKMLQCIHNIDFIGKQPAGNIVELFKKSFCLLHPTYIDNSPNSVCEAQIAGLPVIATNVGGVASLIESGVSGLLVERYEYDEIASCILNLKDNGYLYDSISQNSKIIARERHNEKSIIDKTILIYNEVIDHDK